MAVLSKAGCNASACHGNQNGKGGFKLSLWGEKPVSDFKALRSGGRVNIDEPTASKVLLKPTLQVKHEGKKRFETGSAEYRILLDWIRAGAAEDSNEAPGVDLRIARGGDAHHSGELIGAEGDGDFFRRRAA